MASDFRQDGICNFAAHFLPLGTTSCSLYPVWKTVSIAEYGSQGEEWLIGLKDQDVKGTWKWYLTGSDDGE